MPYRISSGNIIDPLQDVWMGVLGVLPEIILAIVVVIIGILIKWIVVHAVKEIAQAIKLDTVLAHTGLDEAMTRAGYKLNSGMFIGQLIGWFFLIVSIIIAADILNLTQINLFLIDIAGTFIPNVIVAAVIILGGSIIAEFLGKVVSGGVDMVGHEKNGKMLGSLVRYAVWIFAIIIALDQVGIAEFYLRTFYQAMVFMIALGGAIAFGLGGKDAAAGAIATVKDSMKK